MEDYEEEGICSICGKTYTNWGNNAQPVNDSRCCSDCNNAVVIPRRIQDLLGKDFNKYWR